MGQNGITICVCVTSPYRNWLIHRKQQDRSEQSMWVFINFTVLTPRKSYNKKRIYGLSYKTVFGHSCGDTSLVIKNFVIHNNPYIFYNEVRTPMAE